MLSRRFWTGPMKALGMQRDWRQHGDQGRAIVFGAVEEAKRGGAAAAITCRGIAVRARYRTEEEAMSGILDLSRPN